MIPARIREPRPEMSLDRAFRDRVGRLVAISSLALGIIFWAAATTTDAGWWALGPLLAGWVLMPVILAIGMDRPVARWGLMVPATSVVVGLFVVLAGLEVGTSAFVGWSLVTAGILVGVALGGWFWYRLAPVPGTLADPISPGRWSLIGLHAGLVVAGLVVILLG